MIEEKEFISRKFNVVENLKMSGHPLPIFPWTKFNKGEHLKSSKPKSAKDFSEAEKSAIDNQIVIKMALCNLLSNLSKMPN